MKSPFVSNFLFCPILLFILVVNSLCLKANDTVFHLNEIVGMPVIGQNISFFIDSTNSISANQITTGKHDQRFQVYDKKVPSFGMNPNNFWVRLRVVLSQETHDDFYLILDKRNIDSISFYSQPIEGMWNEVKTGLAFPYSSRDVKNRRFVFDLRTDEPGVYTYYLKIKTSATVQFPLLLATQESLAEADYHTEKYYGIYFGILICMMMFNLVLFLMLKHKNYLLYSITILCSLLLFSALSGHLYEYITPELGLFNAYSTICLSALLVISVCLFMPRVLEIRKYLPWMKYPFITYGTAGVMIFLANIIFGQSYTVLPINLSIGLLSLTIVVSAFITFFKGNKNAIYVAMAWLAYASGGLVIILVNLDVIPYQNIYVHAGEFGSALETILIAFALGHRYNAIKKEKEHAQVEMLQVQQKANAELEHKVEQRTKVIRDKNQALESSKLAIEAQNQQIKDSIAYAYQIQRAMLPEEQSLKQALGEYFILFKPRDVVSGDFYWCNNVSNDEAIIAATDCTGHGVPGAFMSVLGNDALNSIIEHHQLTQPAEILNALNKTVQSTLNQSSSNNRDGMDMAVCTINRKEKKLCYAGANNPLIQIKDGEFVEYKANKMAIGGFHTEKKVFQQQEVELDGNSTFYIYSDGYQDQFGGPKNKKFMVKKFKQLLHEIALKPMAEQKQILEARLIEWMGNSEQVDDILIIGFRA